MKNIEATYIESGTFVAREEHCFLAGIEPNNEVIIIKKEDFEKIKTLAANIKKSKIINKLRKHNDWRRGKVELSTAELDPAEIGLNIDLAIKFLNQIKKFP